MKQNNTSTKNNVQLEEVAKAFTAAIKSAIQKIEFDLRCIDWCSYNPDFHIKKQDIKTA